MGTDYRVLRAPLRTASLFASKMIKESAKSMLHFTKEYWHIERHMLYVTFHDNAKSYSITREYDLRLILYVIEK